MFNVAVLKMKDIIKYFIGLLITILVVVTISKSLVKDTKNEEKLVQEIKSGFKYLSQNTMLECLEETVPSISTLNAEYMNIAKEDDEINEEDILQEVLKTQISSIKGIEKIEKNNEVENKELQVATNENNQEKENVQVSNEEVRN